MVESENSENEENKENKPEKDEKPDLKAFFYIDLEQIQEVLDASQPMIETFWTIWTQEKTEQEQLD